MRSSSRSAGFIKAASLLAFFGLASRFVGLLRDRILASHFGASHILDIYYTAFRIPDFIFNLIITGAIASAFIPVFLRYYKRDEQEGWDLVSNFINSAFVGVVGLAAVVIIFAPWLVPLIAPGFDSEQLRVTVSLTRLMFLSPIIFAISTIIGAVLQSLQRFLAYAIAPIFYNLGIILGAIYFEPHFGILGLGMGVVLGALLHLLIQLVAFMRTNYRWRAIFDLHHQGLYQMIRLMIPRTFGLASGQFNLVVSNALASTIAVGSIAILNFANNLWIVPVSMVGVAIPIAVFPALSDSSADGDDRQFIHTFSQAFRQIVFFSIPATCMMIIFREPIIQILLGAGNFGVRDVSLTAAVLSIFALSITPFSLEQLVNRAFYARHNTAIPVLASIAADVINILLAFIFVRLAVTSPLYRWLEHLIGYHDGNAIKVLGLALALSIANIFNFLFAWFEFERLLQHNQSRVIRRNFLKIILAACVASLVYYATRAFIPQLILNMSFLTQLINTTFGLLIFSLYFILLAALLGVEEVGMVMVRLKRLSWMIKK